MSFKAGIKVSLFIIDRLNIFRLRYTAIVLESRDWRSHNIQNLEGGPLVRNTVGIHRLRRYLKAEEINLVEAEYWAILDF